MVEHRFHTRLRNRLAADSDGSGGSRLLAVGSVAAVLLSALTSLVAYGVLPDRMRIHWTLGMGPYYGPEFAPAWLVLGAFPVLVATVAGGAYWLDARLPTDEAFAAVRPYYWLAVLATLAAVLVTQAALVLANL